MKSYVIDRVGQQKSYVCLQGGWVGQKRAKNMLMHPHLVLSKFAANNYKRMADLEKMALTFSKKSYPKIWKQSCYYSDFIYRWNFKVWREIDDMFRDGPIVAIAAS